MRNALAPTLLNVLLSEEEARDDDFQGVFTDATASPGLIEGSDPGGRALMGGGSTFLRTWAESSRCKTLRCGEGPWQNIKKGVIEETKFSARWGGQQEKVSQVEKGKDAEE